MSNPASILVRSLRRDAAIRESGNEPGQVAESHIIDFIVKHSLYDSDVVRAWLIQRSRTNVYWVADKIVECIQPMIDCGYPADALAVFSTLIGIDDESTGSERRKESLHANSLLRHKLDSVLELRGLISANPDTWGGRLIQLQSVLLTEAEQEEALAWGKRSKSKKGEEPDYEHPFHYWFYQSRTRAHHAWESVAKAVENGLAEAAAMPEATTFRILADALLATRWGLATCQPLVALLDFVRAGQDLSWQQSEAIRLVCLPEVERRYAAFPWRRLLRRELLVRASAHGQSAMPIVIREAQTDDRVRINELADFAGFGLLTRAEETEVELARASGELFEPTDTRALRSSASQDHFSGESPTNDLIRRWPYTEDHDALRLLVKGERIPVRETDGAEAALFLRLESIAAICSRREVDDPEWFGEVLGWCERAVEDLKDWQRARTVIPEGSELNVDDYVSMLSERAPWWKDRVVAALRQLRRPAPSDHASHDSDHLTWSSKDPIASSLTFLDEVLAAPRGSILDEYRAELAVATVASWDEWPRYTRGLAIATLRTYYWAIYPALAERLIDTLRVETHSHDVEFALHHLLQLGQPGIAEVMRSLIERIDELNAPSEIADLIGGVIGDAVMRSRASGQSAKELSAIALWYDELSADRTKAHPVRPTLIASILQGARRSIAKVPKLTDSHSRVWLSLTVWGLNEWLDFHPQHAHLPLLPITAIREMGWTPNQRKELLSGLSKTVMRIIEIADVDCFYEMHYELKQILKECGIDRREECWSQDILIEFCRVSANRVASWRNANVTTNDIAYSMSLSGQNTSELINLVFDCASDRESARRELAPIIDVLADAGLRETASRIRSRIRSA